MAQHAVSARRGMSRFPGWTRRPRASAAALGAAVLVLAAAGCASHANVTRTSQADEFQREVIQADKPVLVEFYKQGCATCVALDATFDELATEYEGRVKFVRFQLMTFLFGVDAPEIKEAYDITFFPTVLLFVKGQERHRWVMHYSKADYRKALEEVAGAAAGTKPPAGG